MCVAVCAQHNFDANILFRTSKDPQTCTCTEQKFEQALAATALSLSVNIWYTVKFIFLLLKIYYVQNTSYHWR